jgi:hypothetical protein
MRKCKTAGVFVDAGDIEYDPEKLPNVYNDTFETMLSMFLRTSCRSVSSLNFFSDIFLE